MTTEDDFKKQLDANPDDAHSRLVFADYLEERGDPRAEGYRALGVLRLHPYIVFTQGAHWYDGEREELSTAIDPVHPPSDLPRDWFSAVARRTEDAGHKSFRSRRAAEDAAALAFSRLPAERRHELLNPEPAAAGVSVIEDDGGAD